MRRYPRSLVIGQGERIRVYNEMEEYEAGLKGYERHRDPEINKLQKGTDKEVLRVKPEVEFAEVDALVRKKALEEARAELKAEARAEARKVLDEEKADVQKANEETKTVPDDKKGQEHEEAAKELTPGQKAAITRAKNRKLKAGG